MLPRAVTGVHVRHIRQTCCPCAFAVAWADFEPAPGTDFALADDLPETCGYPGEPLPEEFVRAFAQGVREAWSEAGGGRPRYTARAVLRDALWYKVDSNPESFQRAGRLASGEALRCVAEGREPRPVGRCARRDRPVPPMPRTLRPSEGSPPA